MNMEQKRPRGRPRVNNKFKIVPVSFFESQHKRIKEYQNRQAVMSTTQAIRELVEKGLKKEKL